MGIRCNGTTASSGAFIEFCTVENPAWTVAGTPLVGCTVQGTDRMPRIIPRNPDTVWIAISVEPGLV